MQIATGPPCSRRSCRCPPSRAVRSWSSDHVTDLRSSRNAIASPRSRAWAARSSASGRMTSVRSSALLRPEVDGAPASLLPQLVLLREGLQALARLGVGDLGGFGPPVERGGRQLAVGLERQRGGHVGVGVLVHRELELPQRLLVLDQEDVEQSLELGIDVVVWHHAIEQSPLNSALRGVERADEVDLLGPPAAD